MHKYFNTLSPCMQGYFLKGTPVTDRQNNSFFPLSKSLYWIFKKINISSPHEYV